MTRRVALLLEYDGGRFAGSQLQAELPTVQSALEDAIERVTTMRCRVAFAGRTDAGVHAVGQVASFTTESRLDDATLARALNARLPLDVAVQQAVTVDPDFDPRRWALWRHYRYVIDNSPTRPVLDRHRAWHVSQPLDVPAMAEAASDVLGHRDFAAFASRLEDAAASTWRDLRRFDVERWGNRVICDLEANAFLPHQVRRMVGSLITVGRGKINCEDYVALLDGAATSAGPAAPPHGLYLVRVFYEHEPFEYERLDSNWRLC